jgi:peptidyl-prolyl cis-trans isomerase D
MAAKKGNRIFVWIMMAFLAVGLVGFGAGGLSGTVRSIGKVGEKDIPVQQYANALSEQIRAFGAQIGTPLSFVQAQQIGLDQAVLAQVVTARTLDNEAARLGVSLGDVRVANQIRAIPAFQGLDNAFSRDTYRMQLRNNGLTEAEFEATLREDSARALLQGAVLGAVPPGTTYAQAMVAYIGERRSVTWASLPPDALSTPLPAPTEDALEAHYTANITAFTAPEVRHVSYAWLAPEMIRDELVVDDQAVRDLYQDRINDFVQPERRLVERLVFGTEDEAQAAKARIDADEITFDALVEERGLDLADVDLGDVALRQLGDAGDAVFAATPGDVVGPLMSSLGPALFRMNAVLAAEEVPFEAAEQDLRNELAAQRARRVISDQSSGIIDLIAGGATIADLAERTPMEAGQIDWSEGASDGIAAYDTFRTAVQSATEGGLPQLVELDDGGLVALQLDGITPPAPIPFDAVRDAVIAGWTVAATREALRAEAAVLAEQITSGEAGPGIGMADPRLTVTVEPDLTRRNFVPGTPEGFLTEVFAMRLGEVRVLDDGDGVILVRLDVISPAATDDPTMVSEATTIADRVAAGIAQDMFDAYSRALQMQTQVTLNDAAIAAVHANLR